MRLFTLKILTSEVQPGSKEVKQGTVTSISCLITGITTTAKVSWLDSSGTLSGSKFTIVQGSHSGETQTSTLTVDSTEVTEDKTYTCRVTSGSFPDSQPFDTRVNVNVYGTFNSLELAFFSNLKYHHIILITKKFFIDVSIFEVIEKSLVDW